MPSVSAIILTRDSQRTIEPCIQAIKPAVDHVIVVDTGSTDDTVQVAKANGAYVYHFEWCDDFSAARNFGDSCATSDWVIHVDSDEILREEDAGKIRKLCMQYRKTSVVVMIAIQQLNTFSDHVETAPVGRMYKRGVIVWRGIIHEQPFHRRGDAWHVVSSDIGLIHDGYNRNVVNGNDKSMRNIRLLQEGIVQEPNNPFYHFFLGRDLLIFGEPKPAIPHLRIAIALMEQTGMVSQLERAHRILGQSLEAVDDYVGAEETANLMVSKFPDKYVEGWYKAPTPQ